MDSHSSTRSGEKFEIPMYRTLPALIRPSNAARLSVSGVSSSGRSRWASARASGGVFRRAIALAPWGLVLSGGVQLGMHAVARGSAYLWLDDPSSAVELAPGDLALTHALVDPHVGSAPDPEVCRASGDLERLSGNDGSISPLNSTTFVSGGYRFGSVVGDNLVKALPPLLVLRSGLGDPLHAAIGMLSGELNMERPGQQTVLERLFDVLLVLSIREAYEHDSFAPRWYRTAMTDQRLGQALHAIHGEPERPWTVSELAHVSAMSRPTFARNFERALDQAPMQYLTAWRMTLARDYLQAGELTIAQIAHRTGYSSPNTFASAFTRHIGLTPGQWRSRQTKCGSISGRE